MAFLRFSRDKRGYEHIYLVHDKNRRGKPSRPRILYWYRTPPGIRVGRVPFDDDVRQRLEAQNPDIAFDWAAIVATPMPPPAENEQWRERRRAERAAKQAQRAEEAAEREAESPAEQETESRSGQENFAPPNVEMSGDVMADVAQLTEPDAVGPAANAKVVLEQPGPDHARRRRRRGGRRRSGPRNPLVDNQDAALLQNGNSPPADDSSGESFDDSEPTKSFESNDE